MQLQFQMKRHFPSATCYAFQAISNCPGTFEGVRQPIIRCVNACVDSDGEHIEHLL